METAQERERTSERDHKGARGFAAVAGDMQATAHEAAGHLMDETCVFAKEASHGEMATHAVRRETGSSPE